MIAQVFRPFAQHVECATHIDVHHRVKGGVIHLGNRLCGHHTSIIDNDIHPAKFGNGFVKQGGDRVGSGDIGLHRDGLVPIRFQAFGQFLGSGGRIGVIDHDSKAICGQSFGKGDTNAA